MAFALFAAAAPVQLLGLIQHSSRSPRQAVLKTPAVASALCRLPQAGRGGQVHAASSSAPPHSPLLVHMPGPQDAGDIVTWLRRKVGPSAVLLVDETAAAAFLEAHAVAVVGFFHVGASSPTGCLGRVGLALPPHLRWQPPHPTLHASAASAAGSVSARSASVASRGGSRPRLDARWGCCLEPAAPPGFVLLNSLLFTPPPTHTHARTPAPKEPQATGSPHDRRGHRALPAPPNAGPAGRGCEALLRGGQRGARRGLCPHGLSPALPGLWHLQGHCRSLPAGEALPEAGQAGVGRTGACCAHTGSLMRGPLAIPRAAVAAALYVGQLAPLVHGRASPAAAQGGGSPSLPGQLGVAPRQGGQRLLLSLQG